MTQRKREVIKMALTCFVRNGLMSTSMGDIAKEVGMRQGGLYYYFENKEEMVKECAELAIEELSEKLVFVAISYTEHAENMIEKLMKQADKYMPLMRFLVSVKVCPEYGNNISDALKKFSSKYDIYAQRFAQKLNCDVETVRPLVYMLIVSTVNYMIFGEASLFYQQLKPIQDMFVKLTKTLRNNDGGNV